MRERRRDSDSLREGERVGEEGGRQKKRYRDIAMERR